MAAEKTGTTEGEAVLKALGKVSFDGPRGMVRMNSNRHAPLAVRLGEVRSDGSIRILETFPNVDPGAQCPDLP
jgi:branched-chain amino acid transport system substrate-binding protein